MTKEYIEAIRAIAEAMGTLYAQRESLSPFGTLDGAPGAYARDAVVYIDKALDELKGMFRYIVGE